MHTIKQLIIYTAAILLFCNNATAQIDWRPIGSAGFSAGHAFYMDLALDSHDTPYVVYRNLAIGDKATVMKYNGSGWVTVGGATFSNGFVEYTSIAIDNNDTPYVVYRDIFTGGDATVMKYNGTSWVPVGSPGFSADEAHYTTIAIDNNDTVYVAYRDKANANKTTVMKYNGANWVTVGIAGFSAAGSDMPFLELDNNGVPYVAFIDSSVNTKVTVMRYNGSNWVTVGSAGFSSGGILQPCMAFDNSNTPYVAFKDYANAAKATVMKFNGTSWVAIGSPGFSPQSSITWPSLAIDNNGTPYLAFRNDGNYTATMMMFNGTNWVNVGRTAISSSFSNFHSMALGKDGTPYLAYADNSGYRATVMKYDCPAESEISICAVLTDTTIDSNIVVWDNSTTLHVDSYKIYREHSGSYVHIASVAGTENSYLDTSADPATYSYNYKLTLLDSCGRETHIDSALMHQTICLKFDTLARDTVSISWNSYVGIPNLLYIVNRSHNGAAFTAIASFSVSGTDTTYLDANPPLGNHRYRIIAALTNPCSSGSTTDSEISSNTITTQVTGITDIADGRHISITPNPAVTEIRVT
ncbi:MAG: hypothetical protein K8F30_03780 [Taibaiella sp.]|nr:hypothetical protein [Taibaiella sp.]